MRFTKGYDDFSQATGFLPNVADCDGYNNRPAVGFHAQESTGTDPSAVRSPRVC